MEQRRLRLGDILDDYCPRERRVTNHAVVAMVEEDVKQTRCTTCDAEHVYKGGKAPRRKKAESTGVLYKEVLAGLTDQPEQAQTADAVVPEIEEPVLSIPTLVTAIPEETVETVEPVMADADPEDDDIQPDMPTPDEGPVHRQLIRAQLPRVEGVKVERQAPEFTIRGGNGRGAQGFRGASGRAGRHNSGNGNNGGGRFGRGQQRGGGQGFGRGPGGGQQRSGGGGPRKRGR